MFQEPQANKHLIILMTIVLVNVLWEFLLQANYSNCLFFDPLQ